MCIARTIDLGMNLTMNRSHPSSGSYVIRINVAVVTSVVHSKNNKCISNLVTTISIGYALTLYINTAMKITRSTK